MTLVEFLCARLDEDEQLARAADTASWDNGEPSTIHPDSTVYRTVVGGVRDGAVVCVAGSILASNAVHIARHDPARVLADVEAKRRIVERYAEHADYDTPDEPYEYATGRIVGLGEAIRLLALPYAGHPDYRQEWTP